MTCSACSYTAIASIKNQVVKNKPNVLPLDYVLNVDLEGPLILVLLTTTVQFGIQIVQFGVQIAWNSIKFLCPLHPKCHRSYSWEIPTPIPKAN